MARRSSSDSYLLNCSSITGDEQLGSTFKYELGKTLRRSCRERKSSTRYIDEVLSTTSKSAPNSPQKKRPKSVLNSTPKRTRRYSEGSKLKPNKKLFVETINPQTQNGEILDQCGGQLLNLRTLSLSGSGSCVVSQAETDSVKEKSEPFKCRTTIYRGRTYINSVQGASSKKKKHKYKPCAKAKSDLDQTDDKETSDDESLFSIKSKYQEKMIHRREKTMPILTESNNYENVSAVGGIEDPAVEMQLDIMDSSPLGKKSPNPKNAVHLTHKNCLLMKNGVEASPPCGQSLHLQTDHIELNAPKSINIFQTQQSPFRKEPRARIAFTPGTPESEENVTEEDSCLPSKSCKIFHSGKEISSVGLPVGPERSHLEKLIDNFSCDGPSVTNLSTENVLYATKTGDIENIFRMLVLGLDANIKFYSSDKQTVLHVAAANGHLMLVHVLIQAGAAVNAMDSNAMTPIMLAIEKRHVSVAQYLIKAGVQLDTRGEDAMTALHLAAKCGLLDVVKHILDTGKVNVNVQDDGGWTPLSWACEFEHTAVAQFVLKNGADFNLRDREQNIALHWSAVSGSLDISEMLLNRGCDINARNIHGDAPLHVAARQDNYECVILFLARNADVDIVNKDEKTPIMCCEDRNSQTCSALSMTMSLKKIFKSRSTRSEVVLFNDISRGRENIPIQCVNAFDNEASPSDYLYIRENCEAIPITMNRSIAALKSCQCDDDCTSSSCGCSSKSFRCWYTKTGRLVDEFNFIDPPMIFECNRGCRCFTTCSNRVLQNGITCRLQLFRTKVKSWGVRTLRDISRGTFICEYVGEFMSDLEAKRREDDSYHFYLENKQHKDRENYCIDAHYYGNISRFINHSCEPNLIPVKIFVDYQDHRFPRIALFSGRSIKANEELGVDRSYSVSL